MESVRDNTRDQDKKIRASMPRPGEDQGDEAEHQHADNHGTEHIGGVRLALDAFTQSAATLAACSRRRLLLSFHQQLPISPDSLNPSSPSSN
ncbi:hypothetical protein dqs_3773 [Azoarcus olearius]|nr:hypothetical protein dqs_3773 [Azoarcus olearius]